MSLVSCLRVYVCPSVFTCAYLRAPASLPVSISLSVYVSVFLCVRALCACACACACTCACVCACACKYAFAHVTQCIIHVYVLPVHIECANMYHTLCWAL